MANWLNYVWRKHHSLGTQRQLTPTEAAQLTELLNAPQSSDAAPKDGMDVVENDEQDAGVESDHENENAMVHHSARSNPQPKAKRKQMEDDSTESSQKAHRKAEEDEDETCTHTQTCTHRHAHRHTQTHTDTHTHTQTDTDTDRHRHRHTDTQTYYLIEGVSNREGMTGPLYTPLPIKGDLTMPLAQATRLGALCYSKTIAEYPHGQRNRLLTFDSAIE